MAKKKLWKWDELSANQKAEIKKEFPRWSDKFLKTLQFCQLPLPNGRGL
ncbi:MAG: hypothetical protein ACTSPI_17545 [Candidatus Heimdallarchaeaceae archaeon]